MMFAVRSNGSGGHDADDDADDMSRYNYYTDEYDSAGAFGVDEDGEQAAAPSSSEGAAGLRAQEEGVSDACEEFSGGSRFDECNGGGSALLHRVGSDSQNEVWYCEAPDV